ncbi:MAG: hypothetical protein HQM08_08270 [Candidatus Riflebacteria bacterium]|nr:hypothetical protein [Candidatus Riflebacteria bacterium]
MYKKSLCRLALVFFFLIFAKDGFCHPYPNSYYKLMPGMPFSYFDLKDLYGQHWVSTYLRGRPIILLTAHRDYRYEVLKWAETLKKEFADTGMAHVLWVINLRRFPWNTSRKTIENQWLTFSPPVPFLLDWNGIIGRALRIDYSIPNIIAIDAEGRLAFHQTFPFSPSAYAGISAQIRALIPPVAPLSPVTGYSMPSANNVAISPNGTPITLSPITPLVEEKKPKGRTGYSY